MTQVPILIIALLDLNNTTSDIKTLEKMLEKARNNKITFVPVKMEAINQVYFMNINLDSYKGCKYTGQTDDQRAIKAFIASVFELCSHILPGREEIIIYHSADYEKEAQMLEKLIIGQRLESKINRSENPNI